MEGAGEGDACRSSRRGAGSTAAFIRIHRATVLPGNSCALRGFATWRELEIMANQTRKAAGKEEIAPSAPETIPALRHAGPALESDPEYFDIERAIERAGSRTPEADIAAEGATAEVDTNAIDERSFDPLTGLLDNEPDPEPLKTRLAGDTSSDPHTDVGPDNAATVQSRGELPPRRQ